MQSSVEERTWPRCRNARAAVTLLCWGNPNKPQQTPTDFEASVLGCFGRLNVRRRPFQRAGTARPDRPTIPFAARPRPLILSARPNGRTVPTQSYRPSHRACGAVGAALRCSPRRWPRGRRRRKQRRKSRRSRARRFVYARASTPEPRMRATPTRSTTRSRESTPSHFSSPARAPRPRTRPELSFYYPCPPPLADTARSRRFPHAARWPSAPRSTRRFGGSRWPRTR